VVKAGVFTVVKVVVYIFGLDFLSDSLGEFWGGNWLVFVAGFTILSASLIALNQDNLKRRLAYSTVSQLSYVVMAAAILTPVSAVGAAMHIAAHAFGKITLFFAAGAIMVASHKTEVSQLAGIGRRMPWTMTAFAVGSLSMIGVPPTAGFVSKWYILGAAMDSETWIAVAVVMLSTLLNAAYFLPIVYAAFFKPEATAAPVVHHEVVDEVDEFHPDEEPHDPGEERQFVDHGEAPVLSVVALCLTAAGTVALFFAPGLPLALAKLMAGGF
jgi:multicomponent Na+:H+ antiporter subunit D